MVGLLAIAMVLWGRPLGEVLSTRASRPVRARRNSAVIDKGRRERFTVASKAQGMRGFTARSCPSHRSWFLRTFLTPSRGYESLRSRSRLRPLLLPPPVRLFRLAGFFKTVSDTLHGLRGQGCGHWYLFLEDLVQTAV